MGDFEVGLVVGTLDGVEVGIFEGSTEGNAESSAPTTLPRLEVVGKPHCGGRNGRHTLSASQFPEQHPRSKVVYVFLK